MSIEDFNFDLLKRAWNRSTSASPDEWSPSNRARGQCAITAVVVQDAYGGNLIRTMVTKPDGTEESHYANLLEHGVIFDCTATQFPEGCEFGPWEERTRDYVLSFPETNRRYMLLVQRLNEVATIEVVTETGVAP